MNKVLLSAFAAILCTPVSGKVVRARAVVLDSQTGVVLLGYSEAAKMWGLPGGAIEAHDINSEAAAFREVLEETSLRPSDLVEHDFLMNSHDQATDIFVLYAKSNVALNSSYDPDKEFSELRWFQPEDMPLNTYADAREYALVARSLKNCVRPSFK